MLAELDGLDERQRSAHPDLAGHLALSVPVHWRRSVPEVLTGQVMLARRQDHAITVLTGVQLGPVLDDVHGSAAREQQLGPVFGTQRVALSLWAPTAQHVTLLTWPREAGPAPEPATAERRTMLRSADGIWTTRIPRELTGCRYLYEVVVYSPATRRLETNLVTDPYATGLTVDSQRAVAVDLADPEGMPEGWHDSHGPTLEQLVDATIYELHVRDFSTSDDLVPEALRGSYLAFTCDGRGSRHLRRLAGAGMDTVHLLPCFDITSVPEAHPVDGPSERELAQLPPDGTRQQQLVAAQADHDQYNWGYDPFHWGVPEGSYTSTPEAADGLARVLEFRQMVHALHDMGLRVVMDQVFTHTSAAGQDPFSVLDRVVPGYYHRLDPDGRPWNSTCMNNVATERVMAEKIMVDMVLRWARHYRVDGFRFDLMGHSSAQNMARVRGALDELDADGVRGREVYLYGEGWNFGEVADNALFVQATQGQVHDSRVATFNDRVRDAVRGGTPFDENPRRQGFCTGLAGDPNTARHSRATEPGAHPGEAQCGGTPMERRTELGRLTDLLALSMAGNLAGYRLPCHDGVVRRGDELSYSGRPAGYATEPWEVVNYVDAHDNETLWDALVAKLPHRLAMDQRVRMNTLALACITLGQSPVFWHGGTDLLRSKSLDRNSFNSGDWFNRLDWTGTDNGFGHGLPPAADNMTRWPWLKPLLADASLKPTAHDVAHAAADARDLLRLRRWTRLFRLGSAELVMQKLTFPLAGTPGAVPGVLTLHVDDRIGPDVDPALDGLVVVLNATPHPVVQELPGLADEHLELGPVQARGADPVVRRARVARGVLEVPGRTAAVFAHPQGVH